METMKVGDRGSVMALKNGAWALREDSRSMRVELGCWLVDLARGGTDWWLTVRAQPQSEPTPQDWYSLGWLVAALGAPANSREATFSTAEPFTWEWPAEQQTMAARAPCPVCARVFPEPHKDTCVYAWEG